MDRDLLTLVTLFQIVAGLGLCFAGYRAWRFWLAIEGLSLGFAASVFVAMANSASKDSAIGAGIGGALVCALLFAGVVPLGTFITIVLHGAWIGVLIESPATMKAVQEVAFKGGLIACLPAFAAVVWRRPWVILYTAIGGAGSAVAGGLLLGTSGGALGEMSSESASGAILGGSAVLGLIGACVQFSTTKSPASSPSSKLVPTPPPLAASSGDTLKSAVNVPDIREPSNVVLSPTLPATSTSQSFQPGAGTVGSEVVALRREIDQLKEQLVGDRQRIQAATTAEQRRLESEVSALRDDRDRQSAGSAFGTIVSLIGFVAVLYWFFAGGGSGSVSRYLFWSGVFNR